MTSTPTETANLDKIRTKYGISFVFYALITFVAIASVSLVWAASAFLGVAMIVLAAWAGLNTLVSLLIVFIPDLVDRMNDYVERSK